MLQQPGPAVSTRARAALGDISNRGLADQSKLGKAGGKARRRPGLTLRARRGSATLQTAEPRAPCVLVRRP